MSRRNRYAHYDSDEYRLPEGIRRTGYDADTGTYSYRDESGAAWTGMPGNRYGSLHKVSSSSPRRTRTEVIVSSREDDAKQKDERKPATTRPRSATMPSRAQTSTRDNSPSLCRAPEKVRPLSVSRWLFSVPGADEEASCKANDDVPSEPETSYDSDSEAKNRTIPSTDAKDSVDGDDTNRESRSGGTNLVARMQSLLSRRPKRVATTRLSRIPIHPSEWAEEPARKQKNWVHKQRDKHDEG